MFIRKYPKKDARGTTYVSVCTIVRFEASDSYTLVYFADGTAEKQSGCLKKHLEKVKDTGLFCRIHNSHAVNLEEIVRFDHDGTLILKDHTCLQVSADYRADLLSRIGR